MIIHLLKAGVKNKSGVQYYFFQIMYVTPRGYIFSNVQYIWCAIYLALGFRFLVYFHHLKCYFFRSFDDTIVSADTVRDLEVNSTVT